VFFGDQRKNTFPCRESKSSRPACRQSLYLLCCS